MRAAHPGRTQPAWGQPFTAPPTTAEGATTFTAQIASVVRLVVLITVALMLRLREPLAPVAALDTVLIVGSVYVVVTTFWPWRSPLQHRTNLFLVCDIGLVSALIWYTGGVQSEYYLLYYLPILHGACRLNFRDAITTSMLAGVSYLFIAVASGPMVPVVTSGTLRAATFAGSVVVLAVFFAVLSHETRANCELNMRLREALDSVSAVYNVARAATAHDNVQEVLDTMLRQAVRLAEAESGALAIIEENDGKLEVIVRHKVEEASAISFDEQLARQAITRREWVMRRDSALQSQESVRELFIPLFAGRTPVAVLQIRSSSPEGIDPHHIEVLHALCAEGAMAIENVRLHAETKRAAAVDYLTGLYNRRDFERRLEAEIHRAARYGGAVSLVLLDVDDFKLCNDSYGHQAGDEVLQALAARITDVIRSEDVAARYGGDEFAIVLPQTDLAGAHKVAQKIQSELQWLRFDWAEEGWRLTVSMGVATSEDELATGLLLQKADRALYQAKGAGKGRICVWRRGGPAQSAAPEAAAPPRPSSGQLDDPC